MNYAAMSDEILKEFDSKIYYTINKIRNDRKRAEINKGYTKNKDIYKEDIYKQYISKLQKPLFSRTLLKIVYKTELTNYQKMKHCLIKTNRDKDSLRIS